jgi:hypothetical protein
MIYGSLYLMLGLFFSGGFDKAIQIIPMPILGVLLLFEGLTLVLLVRDISAVKTDFAVAVVVALMVLGLPYGYLVGLTVGTSLAYLSRRGLTALGREEHRSAGHSAIGDNVAQSAKVKSARA